MGTGFFAPLTCFGPVAVADFFRGPPGVNCAGVLADAVLEVPVGWGPGAGVASTAVPGTWIDTRQFGQAPCRPAYFALIHIVVRQCGHVT